jgi:transcription elongation factor Elf1
MKHNRNCVNFHRYLIFLGKAFEVNSLPATVVFSAQIDKLPCSECGKEAQLSVNSGKYQISKSARNLDLILPGLINDQEGTDDGPF